VMAETRDGRSLCDTAGCPTTSARTPPSAFLFSRVHLSKSTGSAYRRHPTEANEAGNRFPCCGLGLAG
jgi:hypothetical protein